jgi:CheY-like chemotaxis protein
VLSTPDPVPLVPVLFISEPVLFVPVPEAPGVADPPVPVVPYVLPPVPEVPVPYGSEVGVVVVPFVPFMPLPVLVLPVVPALPAVPDGAAYAGVVREEASLPRLQPAAARATNAAMERTVLSCFMPRWSSISRAARATARANPADHATGRHTRHARDRPTARLMLIGSLAGRRLSMCYLWVVSHDAPSRKLLCGELEEADLGVAEIGSLGHALTHVAVHGSPCVIVLDLDMPAAVRDTIMESLLVRERLGEVPRVGISNLGLVATDECACLLVAEQLALLTRGICTPRCHCHDLMSSTSGHSLSN